MRDAIARNWTRHGNDWALNKEAAAKGPGQAAPGPPPEEKLKPKLEPTSAPARRTSHLDPMDKP